MTKTLPKNKKCKKAKWLSEEALHIAEDKREQKARENATEYRVPKNSKERQESLSK